jgi:hypothetical protein
MPWYRCILHSNRIAGYALGPAAHYDLVEDTDNLEFAELYYAYETFGTSDFVKIHGASYVASSPETACTGHSLFSVALLVPRFCDCQSIIVSQALIASVLQPSS